MAKLIIQNCISEEISYDNETSLSKTSLARWERITIIMSVIIMSVIIMSVISDNLGVGRIWFHGLSMGFLIVICFRDNYVRDSYVR